MFLSALALAAVLQATPEIALKGYLPDRRAIDATKPVDQLFQPQSRRAKALMAKATPGPRLVYVAPRGVRAKLLRAPKKDFVVNPQMTNCKTDPQLVGNSEHLQLQPLSKMPKAHGERAVARLVNGCPVAVLIAQR